MSNTMTREPIYPILETMVALAWRRAESTAPTSHVELHRLRQELREQLVSAKRELARDLTEKDSYLLLFPLVVHLDEIVQLLVMESRADAWPLLQKDLFDTEKGGELFYRALDELLETDMVNPLVYEVYSFCLGLGFRGRHVGDEAAIAEYRAKLADRLQAPPPAPLRPLSEAQPASVRRIHSHAWYYVVALMGVVIGWFIFDGLAGRAVARAESAPAPVAARS